MKGMDVRSMSTNIRKNDCSSRVHVLVCGMDAHDDLYEDLDHTADAGMRVRADTFAHLCERAARAMFSLVVSTTGEASPAASIDLHIALPPPAAHGAPTVREQLLHAWLGDLLHLHMTRRVLPVRFEVLQAGEDGITARIGVVPLTDALVAVASEIKAVTWHGFRIAGAEGALVADIIFDL